MSEFRKPATVDLEIILNPNKVIMSKTDKGGILEFANDYFVEVSGYEEYELMGKSIYCTQHPDMPEVIFKLMWEKLLRKENFPVLIKNLAKNGKFYWAISDFAFKTDDHTGELLAIYNRRKSAPRSSVIFFSKLYKKLKDIENESGIALSEKYLMGHLEEIGKNFVELSEQYNEEKGTSIPKKAASVISIVPTKPKEKIVPKLPVEINLPVKEQRIHKKEPIAPITVKKTTKKISSYQSEIDAIIQKNKELQGKVKQVEKTTPIKRNEEIVKATNTKENSIVEEKKAEKPKVEKPKVEKPKVEKKKVEKKKGFFQKMFGKTEEELEEERRRKNR